MSEQLKINELQRTNTQDFEISDDKLQMLNKFIHENLKNRSNRNYYNLLHTISEMMTRGIKIKNRHISKITTLLTEDQTKKIALQFFKDLDQELYEKAKTIVEGDSEIDFNMYKLDKTEDFSRTKSDDMPVHTKAPSVLSKNGKSAVYIPCMGTIEDVYSLVHELSHTFDLTPNDTPTRHILGEVAPYCFEAMLSKYLVEKKFATKEDVTNIEKATSVVNYDNVVETFAKLELMKIKEQQGDIKQEDITGLQKKYGITNRQLGYVLERLVKSKTNVDFRARYMMAQLIYPYYMEQYEQNPQSTIIAMKKYFEQIKTNNFEGCLQTLGINPSIDSVKELIEIANRRFSNFEYTIMFSEAEIGKATINVPTEEKNKAKKQIETQKIAQHQIDKNKHQ